MLRKTVDKPSRLDYYRDRAKKIQADKIFYQCRLYLKFQLSPFYSIMTSPLPPTRSELRRLVASGQNLGANRPLEQIVADLSWPVPAEYLDWKEKPALIPYIGHDTITWVLNYVAPDWSNTTEITQVGNLAVCTITLTIPTATGPVTRQSTGSANLDDESFGGPICEAEAQAWRRVLRLFGLGLYLYDGPLVKGLIDARRRERVGR